MKRYITLFAATIVSLQLFAQQPLCFVNGEQRDEEQVRAIPPADIENVEMLPADEETIARYGLEASHGVMLVTLRFDQPARFKEELSFADYITEQVAWANDEPAARVILRYTISAEGKIEVTQELESTDVRLKRRIMKAIAESPLWTPASKSGSPIASEGVLRLELPVGKRVPRPAELVFR